MYCLFSFFKIIYPQKPKKKLKKVIYHSNVMSESGGSHLGMNISQTKTQAQSTGWCLAAQNRGKQQ